METVLIKAAGFLVVIIIGYIMKRIGVFSRRDGKFLSKLVMQITLPAAVISGFQGFDLDFSMSYIIFFGLGTNLIMMLVALWTSREKVSEVKAFYILNVSTYNIGAFTVPFAQAFFSSTELGMVCLFDVGNAIMSLGLMYSYAYHINHSHEKIGVISVLKRLFSSVALDVYLIMFVLSLLRIHLPEPVVAISSMIGSANGFVAMLMIGILFEIRIQKNTLAVMGKILCLRYGGAAIMALITWFLLPLPEMMRQILVIVYFSPILSISPILCGKCRASQSDAAVLNSISIPIGLICMTGLMLLFV